MASSFSTIAAPSADFVFSIICDFDELKNYYNHLFICSDELSDYSFPLQFKIVAEYVDRFLLEPLSTPEDQNTQVDAVSSSSSSSSVFVAVPDIFILPIEIFLTISSDPSYSDIFSHAIVIVISSLKPTTFTEKASLSNVYFCDSLDSALIFIRDSFHFVSTEQMIPIYVETTTEKLLPNIQFFVSMAITTSIIHEPLQQQQSAPKQINQVFLIGHSLFFQIMQMPHWIANHLDLIYSSSSRLNENLFQFSSKHGHYTILPNDGEDSYYSLIELLYHEGSPIQNHHGVPVFSLSSPRILRLDVQNQRLPMIYPFSLPFDEIISIFLFFLSGSTDSSKLASQLFASITSREQLNANGFEHYPLGDIGPSFGFQMIHSGTFYTNSSIDYTSRGINQLSNVIHLLRTEPFSSNHVISFWNVQQLHQMAVLTDILIYQFYVTPGTPRNHLSLSVILRKGNLCHSNSVPLQISLASLFLFVVAHCVDMLPFEVLIHIQDCFIHQNPAANSSFYSILKSKRNGIPFSFVRPFRFTPAEMITSVHLHTLRHEDFDFVDVSLFAT
jgi:thymidylate synthase